MTMQLDVNRRRPSPDDLARVRAWAVHHLQADATVEQTGLVVSELACREPGCPPVETVISVLGPNGARWTIHKPASEVTETDVALTISQSGESPTDENHS
jgi:hypothetical protein